jgi:4-hydroxy-tetrahydrodipicolinate synthase
MHGVIAAAATPINEYYKIDIENLVIHTQWLLSNGCNGVAVFGTTGEANSFSIETRKNTISQLSKHDINPDQYIIGTGSCALEDAVNLTRNAVLYGFKHVLMLPPFYYKKVSEEGLLAFFSQVINQVEEPDLKIYLYHFPAMSGVPFSQVLIARLIEKFPGIIAGIKDSSGDFENMKMMCHQFPDFEVFAGTERFLYPVLQEGGAGCISATVNVTSGMAGQVYKLWKNDQDATNLQEDLIANRAFLEKYPVIPAVKGILSVIHQDETWRQTVPPNLPLQPEELEHLLEAKEIKLLLNKN